MATPARPAPSPTASPRTPQRGISSTYSSPGSFRTEDDVVIFEIGARYLRAGLSSDNAPRCKLSFGPEESRRVGDYRRWLPGYEDRPIPVKKLKVWGTDHELWRLHLRDVDLGLVEDKIERALRDAYTRFLLLDAKSRRVILVVPTTIAHPLLSIILSMLFNDFQVPSITLLPPSTMSVVAAGQRSGLVVDIGWHETTVTAVYELREMHQYKSTRAMKLVASHSGKLFQRSLSTPHPSPEDENIKMTMDFSYAEELLTRVIWCRTSSISSISSLGVSSQNLEVSNSSTQKVENDPDFSIPIPKPSSRPMKIPFSSLSQPVESALFGTPIGPRETDDEEHPVYYMLYEALVSLPPDVRSICMSRIMFTGGGARIPGVKMRLLNELTSMVEARGWDPVWGKAAEEQQRRKEQRVRNIGRTGGRGLENTTDEINNSGAGAGAKFRGVEAAFEDQESDPIDEKLKEQAAKVRKPNVAGVIRGLETLGPWAGASLTAALRIKSVVEIDRDMFLQHGLAGAKRLSDLNPTKPKSQTGSLARTSLGGSEGWTLGAWA